MRYGGPVLWDGQRGLLHGRTAVLHLLRERLSECQRSEMSTKVQTNLRQRGVAGLQDCEGEETAGLLLRLETTFT